MIFTHRYNRRLTLLLFIFVLVLGVFYPAVAQRNVCDDCRTINMPEDIRCKSCQTPLNLCLDCGTENAANADYCSKCNAPLAEMRILGRIDPKVREELKLGQSERAKIDKELTKIQYLLEKKPERAEKLIYKRSMLLHRMKFFSREAESWREFLTKFPESSKKSIAKIYLADSLRKWGYLFYTQKNIESAKNLFKEATETNPASHEAWQWLGRVLMETGSNTEAGEAYMKALEAKPGDKISINFLRKLKVAIPPALLQAKER